MGCQGRNTLEPAPESLARRADGLTVVAMKGYCRVPGTEPVDVRSRTSLLSNFFSFVFCLVTCVCEGCLKSVFEWTEKKKKEKKR